MIQSLRAPRKRSSPLLHDDFFNQLRDREYSRLSRNNHIYLDYTGGGLYAESQITSHQRMLVDNVFGNPHSSNPTSQYATDLVAEARAEVLKYFNATDYCCIFTSNASGALKIVGECYPFCSDSHFLLLSDNHNSVNGIREYCRTHKGNFTYSRIQYEDLMVDREDLEKNLNASLDCKHKLFAMPAQSNVTGVRHDLGWVDYAQERGWDVLLDAAAYVPTSRLDLTQVRPQFVSISFYKIFGYPTGLGCLLVRNDVLNKLQKRWFAGGTVSLVSVLAPYHFLASGNERFENGTVNYLDIPAIKIGLDFINKIGIDRLHERISALADYLTKELKGLKYASGASVVRIFGPEDRAFTGGTIVMAFFNKDGSPIPFEEIQNRSNKKNISIRSGCFCNPGIDEINNCITSEELSTYFTSRESGDYHDMIKFLHKMRGAVRVSVGIATTKQDLDEFIQFVKSSAGIS